MKKLVLKNSLAPGDIVMLTAAVRDLHRCYPNQFQTDVRTSCPDLWLNNPYVRPFRTDEPGVEVIECSYPLINRCDRTPYHCLHGFIEFLNERLKLQIRPTEFKGDIHLSPREKAWFSQVHERTGEDSPFWIIVAGGKFDVTIKWWAAQRFQEVVDHFRGRIQFVQVGNTGHYHPKLDGVIDLRGRTNLRQLVRLVYHAQGVVCPVTALMHLAAAVEVKVGRPQIRPCVVIAGGREPAHWEAYPGHQFLHTIGTLPCCATEGCWKARTVPLGDGDDRDQPHRLCVDVVNSLPRCMDMISSAEVIRRIEMYFDGGASSYLSASQARTAARGITATQRNQLDDGPLNVCSARPAMEDFIRKIPSYPDIFHGRGIVICGGGARYFTPAWVCIHMLRRLGCTLPIQLWHLGAREMSEPMKSLLAPLGVQCADAEALRQEHPVRRLTARQLKSYAILHCPFEEVMLLDADNVPVVNPEFLFETPQFRSTGAVFWPDVSHEPDSRTLAGWRMCGLERPVGPQVESGQILVNKRQDWKALSLCLWFNENADFFYRHFYDDEDMFRVAFEKMKQAYVRVNAPPHPLDGTLCQHDFEGRRIFQHRHASKWNFLLQNRRVSGFQFEDECRAYVKDLQQRWDGGVSLLPGPLPEICPPLRSPPSIQTVVISCPERRDLLQKTMKHLARTGWDMASVHVQMDGGAGEDHRARQTQNAWLALQWSLTTRAEYVLFLEDDLVFNHHLPHNLENWRPLRARQITLGGLYNLDLRESAYDRSNQAVIVAPDDVFGSQAFVISRSTVEGIVRHWNRAEGMQDIRMSRIAGRLRRPIFFHCPSLVQHVGAQSVWGGEFHQARDFDPDWQAPEIDCSS